MNFIIFCLFDVHDEMYAIHHSTWFQFRRRTFAIDKNAWILFRFCHSWRCYWTTIQTRTHPSELYLHSNIQRKIFLVWSGWSIFREREMVCMSKTEHVMYFVRHLFYYYYVILWWLFIFYLIYLSSLFLTHSFSADLLHAINPQFYIARNAFRTISSNIQSDHRSYNRL